jgi:hypothetical protein
MRYRQSMNVGPSSTDFTYTLAWPQRLAECRLSAPSGRRLPDSRRPHAKGRAQPAGSRPRKLSELAKPFDRALPSFMKHIRFLEESDLIVTRKVGRVRSCALEKKRLAG